MTPTGRVLKESSITHDPGQPAADFTISLPQSVDVCTLRVRISAGNSAGMSAPSEADKIGMLTTIQVFTFTQKLSSTCRKLYCFLTTPQDASNRPKSSVLVYFH